jgi:hypothetical protein
MCYTKLTYNNMNNKTLALCIFYCDRVGYDYYYNREVSNKLL